MSAEASKLVVLKKQAERNMEYDINIHSDFYERLAEAHPKNDTSIRVLGKMNLSDRGYPQFVGELYLKPSLICQRCLAPVVKDLCLPVHLVFYETLLSEEQMPDGFDQVQVSIDEPVNLLSLLEEDLLLGIPLIPMHEQDCLNDVILVEPEEPKTQTRIYPFESLAGLLVSKKDK
jgi:uncharacterized protein